MLQSLLLLLLLPNLALAGERILPYSTLELPDNSRLPPGLLANLTLPANLWRDIGEVLRSGEVGDSGACIAKITSLISGASTPESVGFIDAAGKPPAGVTQGGLLWIGGYDMCITMRDASKNYFDYCKIQIPILFYGVYPATLLWSGCLPLECRTGDLAQFYAAIAGYINKLGAGIITMDPSKAWMSCLEPAEWDTGAYVAVSVLSVFAALVTTGTLWYMLDPIIESLRPSRAGDKTVLVNAEENSGSDIQEESEPAPKEEGRTSAFLKCFALQRSFATLIDTDTKTGRVTCLDGIRVLSINWVVLAHLYAFGSRYSGDLVYAGELEKRRGFLTILNGFPSVDSFFTLSGFLVAYLLLKQLSKRGGLSGKEWGIFYIHRYIRLSVPYAVVILVEGFMYRLWVEGPNTDLFMGSHSNCKKNWWTDLLYINNLNPWKMPVQLCVGQSWYLANDMQMFVVAPLFVAALFYKPLIGLCSTFGAILGSVVATIALVAHYDLPFSMAFVGLVPSDFFWTIYDKPWIRMTPYLVGILGGWFYWKKGDHLTRLVQSFPEWKKVLLAIPIWLVTGALEYAVVYGIYHDLQHKSEVTKSKSMAYNSLSRIAWGLALTIQIVACQCGLGGFINSLLSWRGWVMLGKLTYNVFLVHLGLFTLYIAVIRNTLPLQPDFQFAVFVLGFTLMSYLVAAVLYLLVEQPVAAVEALTIRKNRS